MKMYLIAILVVAAGVLGWYLMPKGTAAPAAENATTQGSGQQLIADDGTYDGSLAALAATGGSYECTIHESVQGTEVDGTVYVSGRDHVRGDFTATVPVVGEVTTHMIADATDTYVWNSMMAGRGFRAARTDAPQGGTAMEGGAVDLNMSYAYRCRATATDPALFILPEGVTFSAIN